MDKLQPEHVTEAARLLVAARASFTPLDGLPEECRPQTIEDGYAVQEAFSREWGLDLAGWKIACTSRDQQRLIGVKHPLVGRVFRPFLLRSPAKISASSYHMLGMESEFAFELKRDIKPKKAPRTSEEVARAVAAIYPAVEIVDSRFVDWLEFGAPSLVADNAANGALVLGEAVKKWKKLDLAKHKVRLDINGETVGKGSGRRVMGHPIKALTWLVNDRSERGVTLLAGQIITTGTCTGLHFAKAGDVGVADFGDLGEVRVNFTE